MFHIHYLLSSDIHSAPVAEETGVQVLSQRTYLMTMVMPRTNISKEITATVKSAYGQRIKVFDTQIPHSIRAVEATAEGKSIFAYDKGCYAAVY